MSDSAGVHEDSGDPRPAAGSSLPAIGSGRSSGSGSLDLVVMSASMVGHGSGSRLGQSNSSRVSAEAGAAPLAAIEHTLPAMPAEGGADEEEDSEEDGIGGDAVGDGGGGVAEVTSPPSSSIGIPVLASIDNFVDAGPVPNLHDDYNGPLEDEKELGAGLGEDDEAYLAAQAEVVRDNPGLVLDHTIGAGPTGAAYESDTDNEYEAEFEDDFDDGGEERRQRALQESGHVRADSFAALAQLNASEAGTDPNSQEGGQRASGGAHDVASAAEGAGGEGGKASPAAAGELLQLLNDAQAEEDEECEGVGGIDSPANYDKEEEGNTDENGQESSDGYSDDEAFSAGGQQDEGNGHAPPSDHQLGYTLDQLEENSVGGDGRPGAVLGQLKESGAAEPDREEDRLASSGDGAADQLGALLDQLEESGGKSGDGDVGQSGAVLGALDGLNALLGGLGDDDYSEASDAFEESGGDGGVQKATGGRGVAAGDGGGSELGGSPSAWDESQEGLAKKRSDLSRQDGLVKKLSDLSEGPTVRTDFGSGSSGEEGEAYTGGTPEDEADMSALAAMVDALGGESPRPEDGTTPAGDKVGINGAGEIGEGPFAALAGVLGGDEELKETVRTQASDGSDWF